MGNVLFAFGIGERDSEDETHVEDSITIRSEICVPMRVQVPQKVPPLALALVFNTRTRIEQLCRA